MKNVGIAVVGLGYWGPNLVRNFYKAENATVAMGCDLDHELCSKIETDFPSVKCTSKYTEVLENTEVDLVAIATPVSTHYALAKMALEAGKHLFIEKPMTQTVEEAEELLAIATEKGLTISIDHPFVFTGIVEKMKELIDAGEMGDLLYYDSIRINLGLIRPDVNVNWDLLPHDLSILNYLLEEEPISAQSVGLDHFGRNSADVAYTTIRYPNNFTAHINVSWTAPVKIRLTILGGSNKMIVADDIAPDEKLRIYDRGVDPNDQKDSEEETPFMPLYRSGDILIPKLDQREALAKECQNVVNAILGQEELRADGIAGLQAMKILVATDESIKHDGASIKL